VKEVDLDRLLQQFESPQLEFKEEVPGGSAIARTAAAFANGRGGKFIIGVRDEDRELVGVEPGTVQGIEEQITNMIHDAVQPQVVPQYTTVRREGKTLIVAHIPPGSLTPYSIQSEGKREGTYIRVGSQTRQADAATIRDLELRRRNLTFDQTAFHEARPEDLSDKLIEEFLEQREEVRGTPIVKPTEEFLRSQGILRQEGDEVYPTVGGVLLFTENPQQWFPYARIKCARFRGTSVGEYIDQKEYEGPIFQQVEAATSFFKTNVQRGAVIEGTYREEKDAYPEVAVREAIANAVCHRDYNIEGSDIKFAMFDDRIEVTSPGSLPTRITVDLLGTGVSEARNRVVAKIFREMGLIEEWGQGTTRMREAMADWDLQEPVFQEQGKFFKVILPGSEMSQMIGTEGLDSAEQRLLSLAISEGRISTGDGIEAIDRSRPTVIKKLNRLEELELLEFHGSGPKDPTGHYKPTREGEQ